MSAAEFNAIKRLLNSGRKTASATSKVWRAIHSETGIGVYAGSNLVFTNGDLQRLREYGQHLTGLDPVMDSTKGTRMELSEKTKNEKTASQTVFGHLLVMATAGNAHLSVSGQEMRSAPGSIICATPEALDQKALISQNIVVIENGSLLPHWNDIRLPPNWENSVLVYRGHNNNAREVTRIIANQPSDKLALYYDFDPEGLLMALRHQKGTILVPEKWSEFVRGEEEFDKKINRRDVYRNQESEKGSIQHLQEITRNTPWEAIVTAMKRNEVAVMQEHITSRNWPLTPIEALLVAR